MAGRCAQLVGPVRPHQRLVLLLGRHGHQLELSDADCAVAVRCTHTVRARVAAANHDDVLAVGADLALELVARVDLVLLRQELHREMDAVKIAARHWQITRLLGTAGQQHGIELFLQLFGCDGFLGPVGDLGALAQPVLGCADKHAGADLHAFGSELFCTTVDVRLLHLEVRNAIAQQATDAVVLFEQGHIVTCTCQLLRSRHARRAGANHGDVLASFVLGRLRLDPAFFPGTVDDGVLNRLDTDGIVVDVQRAGCFAWRGADAAGELGEVVGAVQHRDRALPVLVIDEVVEVRNDVVDRAAVVAKRRAAVHAARALDACLLVVQADDEFLVVLQALGDGLVAFVDALIFHEAGGLSHDRGVLEFMNVVLAVQSGRSARLLTSRERLPPSWPWSPRRASQALQAPCAHKFPTERACTRSGTPSRTCCARQPSCRAARGHGGCRSSVCGLPAAS
ncbi:hypothetical protein SDC9_102021 [bioreactor metagenome]|uniref:Uncharacterized protein n=1 Tax=bioreactor metagenome TaxID=1076179 RepID=A0A645AR25_9ZZZZ